MPQRSSKRRSSRQTKKTGKKGSSRKRVSRSRPETIVVEETTRVIPVARTEVRAEPVTLARALGETAVVEEKVEPEVTRVGKRRRRA